MNNFEATNYAEGNYAEDQDDLWYVQFPTGAVRVMTLDQLDEAFERGLVDGDTLVRQDGSTSWARLAEIAGLDAPAPAPAPQTRTANPPPVYSARIAAPAYAAREYAPQPPHSIRPMVSEVSDLELGQMRSKKRPFVVFLAAAVILGGGGVAATRYAGLLHLPNMTSAPVAAAAPPPAPAPVVPVNADMAAAVANAHLDAPAKVGDSSGSRLTEEQKRLALEMDKTRASKKKSRSSPAPRSPRVSGGPVFHNGGNKYDPLNSSL